MGYHRKLSLTGQWQFWLTPWWDVQSYWKCHWLVNDSFRRKLKDCHWPVNDNFEAVPLGAGQSRESLTYHFDYGHTTYGQMSLTTVNDKILWTKLKKKCHWPWSMTKKLSFTERYLSTSQVCYSLNPCWKGLSVFHFWLFFHLPLDTNVMAIQMGINILDIFAGGWHKKLVPIEKGVCYDTWLRHSCNPFLESCASWIFCWPSRRVNNNSLIFWSFSQGRSIVEIKFLFLYCPQSFSGGGLYSK